MSDLVRTLQRRPFRDKFGHDRTCFAFCRAELRLTPGVSRRDAQGQPTPRLPPSTFQHSPVPAEGEMERLFGQGFLKPRLGQH